MALETRNNILDMPSSLNMNVKKYNCISYVFKTLRLIIYYVVVILSIYSKESDIIICTLLTFFWNHTKSLDLEPYNYLIPTKSTKSCEISRNQILHFHVIKK